MAKTNAQIGFKTRYGLRAFDPVTNQPIGEHLWVENLVLDSGYSALGNEIAYREIAIGTSKIPADPSQENIITPIATLPLTSGSFEQAIFEQDGKVISRVTRELMFKNFLFPSNARTLSINEIGLVGVTRAVLPQTFEIDQSNWLEIVVQIDYTYNSQPSMAVTPRINKETNGEVLQFSVTPFIYNPSPENATGRGWAMTNSILGYVWDGTDENVGVRTYGATLGLAVTAIQEPELHRCRFRLTGKFNNEGLIPGFIIRDVVNGGGFKFGFGNGLVVEEDDAIDIDFVFNWGPYTPIERPPILPQ